MVFRVETQGMKVAEIETIVGGTTSFPSTTSEHSNVSACATQFSTMNAIVKIDVRIHVTRILVAFSLENEFDLLKGDRRL